MPQINQSLLTESEKVKFSLLLKQWLLPENVKDIAARYNFRSNAYIYHVINFRRKNNEIFNESIELALKNKREHEERVQQVEKDFNLTK